MTLPLSLFRTLPCRLHRRALLLALSAGLLAGTGQAAPPPVPAEPGPNANPVLAAILTTGAKLYYLGSRDGLDGWFIVKDGQVQIAYAQPKSKQALIGALFGPDGENITANQVENFLTAHKDISDMLNATAAAAAAGAPVGAGMPAVPPVAGSQPVQFAAPPAPVAAASPGERLLADLQNAAGVTVGSAGAPLLVMVMDPDCPHCKATWRALREAVFKNQLQIRLVPIATTDEPERARVAAQLLHLADPLNGWDKWVAGDKSQLAGDADPRLLAAINLNRNLTDSWHIAATPFLVYRGRNGKVKIIQGEPDQVPALLADVSP